MSRSLRTWHEDIQELGYGQKLIGAESHCRSWIRAFAAKDQGSVSVQGDPQASDAQASQMPGFQR
jgi:hypothetical protein